jgi:protein-S-isoprenylcysteine O-methyltransferase Ste14
MIGIPIAIWLYTEIPKEERGLILKFGDAYRYYMQEVPRLNPLQGVIRLLTKKIEE